MTFHSNINSNIISVVLSAWEYVFGIIYRSIFYRVYENMSGLLTESAGCLVLISSL